MALKPITVSQLNRYIGKVLSTDPILGNVSVQGEISNLKYHGSGHVYFTLKDAGSKINCFLHASAAENLRYELTDGIEAVVMGYLSVYEAGRILFSQRQRRGDFRGGQSGGCLQGSF